MTTEQLRAFLRQREVDFTEKEVQNGIQFKCSTGESFVAYSTGRVVCGGKRTNLSKDVERWKKSGSGNEAVATLEAPNEVKDVGPDRRLFIVYGHDDNARTTLELLLRRMGLEPIILQRLPAGGDTIIEK